MTFISLFKKACVTLLEAEPETLEDKKGDVQAKGLIVTLDDNLVEAEAKRY